MALVWEYAAVAFIDVLGFSNLVAQDAMSLEPHHLERLHTSLQEVKGAAASKHLDVRAFSDSIVISTELSSERVTELLETVVHLQALLVKRGVLIRGAVAFGKHFADTEFIYSDALIKAYTEERDQARFPRVLLNKDLLDWYKNDQATSPEVKARVAPLCMTDRDERVFLHYLTPNLLADHLSLLQGAAKAGMTPSVLEKIQWLAEYHNFIAREIDSTLVFDGAVLDGMRPTVL